MATSRSNPARPSDPTEPEVSVADVANSVADLAKVVKDGFASIGERFTNLDRRLTALEEERLDAHRERLLKLAWPLGYEEYKKYKDGPPTKRSEAEQTAWKEALLKEYPDCDGRNFGYGTFVRCMVSHLWLPRAAVRAAHLAQRGTAPDEVWTSCGLDSGVSVRSGVLVAEGIEQAFDRFAACFLYDKSGDRLLFDCRVDTDHGQQALFSAHVLSDLKAQHLAWIEWHKSQQSANPLPEPTSKQKVVRLPGEQAGAAARDWFIGGTRGLISVSDCRYRQLKVTWGPSAAAAAAAASTARRPSSSPSLSSASSVPSSSGGASASPTSSSSSRGCSSSFSGTPSSPLRNTPAGPSRAMLSTHAMAARAQWKLDPKWRSKQRNLPQLNTAVSRPVAAEEGPVVQSGTSTPMSASAGSSPTSSAFSSPRSGSSQSSSHVPFNGNAWVTMMAEQRLRWENGGWDKDVGQVQVSQLTARYYFKSNEKKNDKQQRKKLALSRWEREEEEEERRAQDDAIGQAGGDEMRAGEQAVASGQSVQDGSQRAVPAQRGLFPSLAEKVWPS